MPLELCCSRYWKGCQSVMLMLSVKREASTLVVPMERLITSGCVSEAILMASCGV